MNEYVPSPKDWVAQQVERYEGSGGTEGLTLRDTGLPVIIVTNRGNKTGATRKTPLMRVADGACYVLVASQGGAPTHLVWYYNLKADPEVEIRDGTEVFPCGFVRSWIRLRENGSGPSRLRRTLLTRSTRRKQIGLSLFSWQNPARRATGQIFAACRAFESYSAA
jgi:hypothetical protein